MRQTAIKKMVEENQEQLKKMKSGFHLTVWGFENGLSVNRKDIAAYHKALKEIGLNISSEDKAIENKFSCVEPFDAESGCYTITFKDKAELISFYDGIREKCFYMNFSLNPFEWACYGYFVFDEKVYCLNAPVNENGDRNWFSYSDDCKKQATIRLITDENELKEIGFSDTKLQS